MANGKIALVTGAGSGIGKCVGTALVGAGWNTVFTGRRLDRLEEAAAAAASAGGGRALAIACDVSRAEQVEKLFERIGAEFGRLDLLFNNAGMGYKSTPIDEIPVEVWHDVVDVNLTGSFLCARAAFGMMRRQDPQGGRIINNGSISAHTPRPQSIAYTATKHAVMGLTKAASLDGRRWDIAVGQIDVGNARTELAERMTQGVQQANGEIASEPMMDVDVVGQSVLYMANLPLSANVLFHTVMATRMPFVGRG